MGLRKGVIYAMNKEIPIGTKFRQWQTDFTGGLYDEKPYGPVLITKKQKVPKIFPKYSYTYQMLSDYPKDHTGYRQRVSETMCECIDEDYKKYEVMYGSEIIIL